MKYLFSFFCMLFVFPPVTYAEELVEKDAFNQAYADLNNKQKVDIEWAKGHLLLPYLQYAKINQDIEITPAVALEQFIQRYANSPLADNLWPRWLEKLVAEKQWQKALTAYQAERGGIKAQCYYLQAKLESKPADQDEVLQQALGLWLHGSSRPDACDGLFSLLEENKQLNDEQYWKRIALAMDKGNTRLANALAKQLSSQDRKRVALWTNLKNKAPKYLSKKKSRKLLSGKHPFDHKILLYGIKRVAQNDTEKAKSLFSQLQQEYQFNVKEKSQTESYIGMQDALNHSPYALARLASIPGKFRDDKSNVWMARSALRQGDWQKVLDAVDAMSDAFQQKDVWRYWKARSLAEIGQHDQSLPLFEALAHDASFYGFLAADYLNKDYVALNRIEPDRSEQIRRLVNDHIGIRRALALFDRNLQKEARSEWFNALKTLDNKDKLAAAQLALQIDRPFVAIVTVAKTKDWNQVGLRFPLQYQHLIVENAQQQELPPAWIYGITRRESAFDANVISHAKAQGLMQLIPPTAKAVARKLDLPRLSKQEVLKPETNIKLGSAYLKELLEKFEGNYVKASAAYNAGPHRIPRWLPDQELEASRWIESIPFKETRNYVRAVMSYTTIYDHKLNHDKGTNLRLSQRLAAISPKELE